MMSSSSPKENTPALLNLSPDLALPQEAVTQTFAILAKRGVGKTYTASVLVEEMLTNGLHVCVVDPVGVWWGLRADATGDGPGLPIYVLGGDHADVPLLPTAGELVADLVVEHGMSIVLDIGNFSGSEQIRFMTDFAERLYLKNRSPLHLVLDEADAFAPQNALPEQRRVLGAIEKLVRRGRARGLGVTMITQRPAVLNKNVLTQIEVLVALRLTSPQDRQAIDAWIRAHGTEEERAALLASLSSLPVGTAWFWSPGWLDIFKQVKIRERRTFDSSATPKLGETIREPQQLAPVDIEALRKLLAPEIKEAESEAGNNSQELINQLRRQVEQLKLENKELREKKPEPQIEIKRLPIMTEEHLSQLNKATELLALAIYEFGTFETQVGEWIARFGPQEEEEKEKPAAAVTPANVLPTSKPQAKVKLPTTPAPVASAPSVAAPSARPLRKELNDFELNRLKPILSQIAEFSKMEIAIFEVLLEHDGEFVSRHDLSAITGIARADIAHFAQRFPRLAKLTSLVENAEPGIRSKLGSYVKSPSGFPGVELGAVLAQIKSQLKGKDKDKDKEKKGS